MIKPEPLDLPPEVGRRLIADMRDNIPQSKAPTKRKGGDANENGLDLRHHGRASHRHEILAAAQCA